MIVASTTFRCRGCTQLLPFDRHGRVPSACLRRCEGRCDWQAVGPTDPGLRERAAADGVVGPDGLPVPGTLPLTHPLRHGEQRH